ncbi:MAG: hypothetical protein N2049_09845 [Anaerolineales bacterium]|nr:hypothetical protein [Anaerolineales bacterium]MCX7609505.1 hypothetical protein [Anaerolineales bacterium]MDW8227732.1 hypothetical protein [Anaerolineales bacterium]
MRLRRLSEIARQLLTAWKVACASRPSPDRQPVLFFNASTRLSGLSQNAAFSLLTSWAVRLSGTPVIHFVCQRGMSRCVLGTDETKPYKPMPCGMCIRQSQVNFFGAPIRWFTYRCEEALAASLQDLTLDQLLAYQHPVPKHWSLNTDSCPLGALVLPSLRWRLRRHHLHDDEPTRFLAREFILSAWNVAQEFFAVLEREKPQMVVLFNGLFFPEATAAWLARQLGVRVITHESGFQPFSAYFVDGEATAYSMMIPETELTPTQNALLDANLERRWQGDFTMAGVRFWKQMESELPASLKQKAARFKQVVVVFSNVIFDTSQIHANILFKDMFTWLDELISVIQEHPETFFIFRAHPDETRPGKTSRETIAEWYARHTTQLTNSILIQPDEPISSYELIRLAQFVLIYNSTIGLESILLGKPALAAGRSTAVEFDTVFYEKAPEAYWSRLKRWLTAGPDPVSADRIERTRRFLYYRTYRFSLPFGEFLEATSPVGYVCLKNFSPADLLRSPTIQAILGGLFEGKPFEVDA